MCTVSKHEAAVVTGGSHQPLVSRHDTISTVDSLSPEICPSPSKKILVDDGFPRSTGHLGSSWSSSHLGPRYYPYVVVASALLYWVLVSIIPLYNKRYFRKEYYPYPIATAAIQLGVVSSSLIVVNIVWHYMDEWRRRGADPSSSSSAKSWILGPHLGWKIRHAFPVGALFGVKYAVTNLGLHLVSAPTHLLLQSTDLVWTALGAWYVNGETVRGPGLMGLVLCMAGTGLLSLALFHEKMSSTGEDGTPAALSEPVFAILVNLASPMLLGLVFATLRAACTELMDPNNRVGGTVGSIELTALKLVVAGAVAGLLATVAESGEKDGIAYAAVEGREGGSGGDDGDSFDDAAATAMASCWSAFAHLDPSTRLAVLFGSVPILAYQVNCTFLTFLTSAVSAGLVAQVKIVPQWISAVVFLPGSVAGRSFSLVNGSGAALTMLGAAAFAAGKWMDHKYNVDDFVVGDAKKCVEESTDVGVTEGQGLLAGDVESSGSDYGTTAGRA